MKHVGRFLFAFMLSILIVLGVERPATVLHPVGKTIEGKYRVYNHADLLGYLDLKGGKYSYAPVRTDRQVIDEGIVGGFYFIQYPEGQYSLDYIYDSVKQDTLLEDLGRYAILLLIQFDARETDRQGSTTADSPYPEHVFLVCTDGENRTIFFQRIVNELQRWWIAKSWD